MSSVTRLKSFALRVRQVLTTCGRNASVARLLAARPRYSTSSTATILIGSPARATSASDRHDKGSVWAAAVRSNRTCTIMDDSVTRRSRRKAGRTGCAVEATLSVIGGVWKPVPVFHLLHGKLRFNALCRITPSATPRMITLATARTRGGWDHLENRVSRSAAEGRI